MPLPFLLLQLRFTLSTATAAFAITTTLSGCPTRCGNLTIRYPFGTQPGCHLPGFLLTCNHTFSPPRAFINTTDTQVTFLNVSASTATILTPITRQCNGHLATATNLSDVSIDITGFPYAISNTRNKFTALGCSTVAVIEQSDFLTAGCLTICEKPSSVINGTCSGMGCCQTDIPRGQRFQITLGIVLGLNNTWNFSPCRYAFLIDQEQYVFKASDLEDFRERDLVPTVLDWAVGNNESCEAAASSAGYLCGENTHCSNSIYECCGVSLQLSDWV